jgi:hypothetical protein
MAIPQKAKHEFLYDSAILLLGTYPKELKSGYQIGTCSPVFIATLFTIDKRWLLQNLNFPRLPFCSGFQISQGKDLIGPTGSSIHIEPINSHQERKIMYKNGSSLIPHGIESEKGKEKHFPKE